MGVFGRGRRCQNAIRHTLTAESVAATSRLAVFVSVDAYLAASGGMLRKPHGAGLAGTGWLPQPLRSGVVVANDNGIAQAADREDEAA